MNQAITPLSLLVLEDSQRVKENKLLLEKTVGLGEDRLKRMVPKISVMDSGCWEWIGFRNWAGYGQTTVLRGRVQKRLKMHRVMWMIANGDIPEGMGVLHKCDNPPCCNPDHLFLGTHKQNMDDMTQKGRRPTGEQCAWSKLVESDVKEIRQMRASGYALKTISKKFGIVDSMVSQIIHRKRWKHI